MIKKSFQQSESIISKIFKENEMIDNNLVRVNILLTEKLLAENERLEGVIKEQKKIIETQGESMRNTLQEIGQLRGNINMLLESSKHFQDDAEKEKAGLTQQLNQLNDCYLDMNIIGDDAIECANKLLVLIEDEYKKQDSFNEAVSLISLLRKKHNEVTKRKEKNCGVILGELKHE